jgi:hypothetical protein
MFLPKSRNSDIILQEVGRELLIYDLKINKAYSLNETLNIVYQSCDGETSYQELKRRHRQLNDDVIKLAVNELGRENLLEEKNRNCFAPPTFDGRDASRRSFADYYSHRRANRRPRAIRLRQRRRFLQSERSWSLLFKNLSQQQWKSGLCRNLRDGRKFVQFE